MTAVIEVQGVSRRYGDTLALDDVSVSFNENTIYGLLGRNGAGKTTLMSIITAQAWPTAGRIRVFGEGPHENERVLPNICFVREEQRYIDDSLARHAFRSAADAFPNWDWDLANRLIEDFKVPEKTKVKKMSRGQKSAVGVIIGLASRAPITFFDEPYMGLDAVARQLFYDRLIEDYAEHPRTMVLSSHLIDEIAHLIEHVVLIDGGSIMVDEPVEDLRDRAVTLVGNVDVIDEIVSGREELHRESMGRMARVTVLGSLTDADQVKVRQHDLEVLPVSLQQLVVRLTTKNRKQAGDLNAPESEVAK